MSCETMGGKSVGEDTAVKFVDARGAQSFGAAAAKYTLQRPRNPEQIFESSHTPLAARKACQMVQRR